MPDELQVRKRLLDPIERSSEMLFGLIMVLTFTGSFRASGADHDSVTACSGRTGMQPRMGHHRCGNVPLATLSQRGHNLGVAERRASAGPRTWPPNHQDAIARRSCLRFDFLRNRADSRPHGAVAQKASPSAAAPTTTGPQWECFCWCSSPRSRWCCRFCSCVIRCPLCVCRTYSHQHAVPHRLAYGKFAGGRPWRVGAVMVVIGVSLVALTIALGG